MFIVSTNKFNYTPDVKMFEVDMSDLQGFYLDKVFVNSDDEGFAILSDKTGDIKRVYLDETKYNRENELTHYVFRPLTNSGEIEEPSSFVVVLYND